MANLVADVSSWNPDTLAFFQDLKRRQVQAVIVKLTEGPTYQNPKAFNQIHRAWAAGLHVHGYHYARYQNAPQAAAEGRFFAATAKKLGLNGTSVLAVDLEDAVLPRNNLTALTNTFVQTIKAVGYPKTDFYAAASWIWNGRLIPGQLIPKNMWIASFGVSQPGVPNVGTWQFTNNYRGLKVDMSDDFKGLYTRI